MAESTEPAESGEQSAGAAIEREALEHCQHAQELIDAGDAAGALIEIDAAYAALLAFPPPARRTDGGVSDDHEQISQDIRLLISRLISRAYNPTHEVATASSDLGFATTDNAEVQREIRSMTGSQREDFIAAYRRSGRYRPLILKKLEEAGLPSQLSWLPLVESWFQVNALSGASALGMWQFISSTGLRYGLRRDRFVDERLDPEKSTNAAIAYLNDLHRMFGDWPKALAAYNCGEGKISRLQHAGSGFMDFWDLYALLPKETRRYVPRLIAAVQIIEDPALFGMELPEPDAPVIEVMTVEINRPVKLAAIDAALSLPAGTTAKLNPALRHQATPDENFILTLPKIEGEHDDAKATIVAAIAALPVWVAPRTDYVIHRVRPGETLSQIATRYHASLAAIMRVNNIRNPHRVWPGQRLRIPLRG
ncbi:MAG: hypothetical protein A2289_26170 [Deltaproteobacteria bacterium RIFOXYA12_FULL_58_15]|nr:MAG: hypothetical protein A2289_26170 [Deltaproteobacteria bacterium RIFOXYA12_FULL_58_15]OGR07589.1 MAG: hypothetical protein A2341_11880 [Deltaproteobacteria bacterium RIFOXYB12_FULL_58_9]